MNKIWHITDNCGTPLVTLFQSDIQPLRTTKNIIHQERTDTHKMQQNDITF